MARAAVGPAATQYLRSAGAFRADGAAVTIECLPFGRSPSDKLRADVPSDLPNGSPRPTSTICHLYRLRGRRNLYQSAKLQLFRFRVRMGITEN